MTLLRPQALLLLLILLPFVFFWFRSHRANPWLQVMDASLLQALQPNGVRLQSLRWWLPTLLLLIIIALAGPALTNQAQRSANQGALFIVLDNSLSMMATDTSPDRSTRAKRMAVDWVKSGLFSQASVITYSASAHTVTPLTSDAATVELQLQQLSPYLMPQFGNRADLAFENLEEATASFGGPKHLLWLTDDVQPNHFDKIETTVEAFSSATLVPVGTEEGSPIPLPGNQGFLTTDDGLVIVKTNRQSISESAQRLNMIVANLGQQPDPALFAQFENTGKIEGGHTDFGYLFLVPIMLLWLFKVRMQYAAVAFVMLAAWPNPNAPLAIELFQNNEQRAFEAWEMQDYETAIEQTTDALLAGQAQFDSNKFEEAAEKFSELNTADGFYNAANALAHAGKLKEALAAYDQALNLSEHEQAKQNKARIEAFLENQESESGDQQGESDNSNSEQGNSESESQPAEDQESEPSESSSNDQQEASEESTNSEEMDEEREATEGQESEQGLDPEEMRAQQASEQILNQLQSTPGSLLQQKFQYQFQQNPSETDSTLW